ncbi:hypothetical protein BS50DRAFT_570874 [Corynespora cassiicola Philippines]|uniref:EthD domain-containing protein n=1 Tax=Corynespora cassiicola Philippines TaxID=1448308 RepID=A0A2T2P1M4_CORCC|nr:hypothetical protein BS50DRAFT_570874 [Corynespora cassiicola Philippines]
MVETTKYPFLLVTVACRKEGMSREEFRRHNEEIYAPLLRKIAGKVHPLAWTRTYHVTDGEGPTGIPPLLIGSEDGLDWDCFGEMTFEDELHYQQFITFINSDAASAIMEEEGNFADTSKTKLVVMRRAVTERIKE